MARGPPSRKQPTRAVGDPRGALHKVGSGGAGGVLRGQADGRNSPNSTGPHAGSPDTSQLKFPAPRPQSAPHTQAGQAPLTDSCSSLGDPDTSPPGLGGGGRPEPAGFRDLEGFGSNPHSPPQRPGLTSPAAWRSSSRTACCSRRPSLRPGGKAWSVGHGGAPRQAPGTPQSEGPSPGRFPAAGHPLPAPGGAILDVGTPPPPASPRPAPLPLVGCAGRWTDGPMRIRDPAGR